MLSMRAISTSRRSNSRPMPSPA
jgi:hypothetical protein